MAVSSAHPLLHDVSEGCICVYTRLHTSPPGEECHLDHALLPPGRAPASVPAVADGPASRTSTASVPPVADGPASRTSMASVPAVADGPASRMSTGERAPQWRMALPSRRFSQRLC